MAVAAPARTRRAPASRRTVAAPAPSRRSQPRPATSPGRRRSTRGVRRPAALIAAVLVIGSLLATVAAHAYLTEGQIQLARLQQQVAVQISAHRDLELRVSQLEDPAHVVVQAQHQGLGAPSQVGDLAQVPLDAPLPTPTTTVPGMAKTPAATSAPKTTTSTTAAAHSTATTTTTAPGSGGTR
jgi:hypothetical protein